MRLHAPPTAPPTQAAARLRLVAVFLCMAGPALARAQTKTALSFVREPGAEGCIAALELGQRIERVVGPVLGSASEGQVSVEGRVARSPDGFAATIVIADRSGQILGRRELRTRSGNCHALDDQLVFVVAVAIDPDAALAELPSELTDGSDPGADLLRDLKANPPQPSPVRPATPVRTARPPPKPPEAPALAVRAGLQPVLGLGQLPSAGLGLGLEVALALGGRPLWLRADAFLPQDRGVAPMQNVSVAFMDIALGVCPWLLEPGGLELALCAAGAAGHLSAEPRGFDGTSRNRWVFGPSLEARLGRRAWGWLWTGLTAGAQSQWPRTSVGYEVQGGFRSVYRVPAITGRIAWSLEARF